MFLDDYPLYRGVVTDYLFRMLEPFYSSKSHASMHASVINPYCKNTVGFSLKHISLPEHMQLSAQRNETRGGGG
jgi:hypothetical protein